MPTKKWTGFKVAVYLTLFVFSFYFLKMTWQLLAFYFSTDQPFFNSNNSLSVKFDFLYFFFIAFQLSNAWTVRHHLKKNLYPSKKFRLLQDFLLTMNVALLGYYVYAMYHIYSDVFAVWDKLPDNPGFLFIFSTIILVLSVSANIYTIPVSLKLRKYLKQQANIKEEAMLNAIGSLENED